MYEFPIRYILSRRRPSRSLRAFLFGAIKKLLHLVRSTGQPPPLLLELDQVVLWGCMPCCWSLRGGTSGVAGANKPTSGWTGKTVVALAGEDAQIPGLGPGAIAIEASSSGAPGCLALEPSTSRRKPDPLLGSPGGCSGRSGIRPSICSLYAKFTKRSKVCFCNSSSFEGSWEGTTAGPKTMKWWVWQNEGGWSPSPSLFITTGGSGGTCLHCFVACVTCPWGSFKVFFL